MAIETSSLTRVTPRLAVDALRAAVELGRAWLWLDARSAKALIAPASTGNQLLDVRQAALVDRVAYVIPRVAARLPWRADCLVQALAAQHWLGRHGIATQLTFGVPPAGTGDFAAHAWLKAGGRQVTGGDISGYVPLARRN